MANFGDPVYQYAFSGRSVTLTELKVRYRTAVFTCQRLLSMAEEARISGLSEAHDHLVAAADEYKKVFVVVRDEAFKAFPQEAADALSFENVDARLVAEETEA
jgi:hypothetical protein